MGVQPLLDGVLDYLPSPIERPPVEGCISLDDPAKTSPQPSQRAAVGRSYSRSSRKSRWTSITCGIYSGFLKSGMRVYNANTGKKENLSRMFRMFAKRREQL